MSICPVSFQPHSLDSSLCTPAPDTTSIVDFQVYYVSSRVIGREIGSADEPFSSLTQAFAAVHSYFVRIYLLRGTHTLGDESPNSYLRSAGNNRIFDTYMVRKEMHVEVQPLYCSNSGQTECVGDDFVSVKFDNLRPAYLHLRGFVRFANIQFEGDTPLVSNCDTLMCLYCPRVGFTDDSYFDDRQNVLQTGYFADQDVCDKFHIYSFINIEPDATVELCNVNFVAFRQQLQSLISFTTGNITLENVTFRNVQVAEAVLLQTGNALSAKVSILHCTVKLLNNGFEFVGDVTYAGFLSASSVKEIHINNSHFSYNILGVAGTLISVSNFIQLTISQCDFQYNLGRIVAVTSSLWLPKNLDSSNNLVYFPLTHISISDSTFRGNSGNSLIDITFSGDLLNTEFTNCRISDSLSLSDGMVFVSSIRPLSKREIDGAENSVLTANSRVFVSFPQSHFSISGLSMEQCSVSGVGLLYLDTLANVSIRDTSILASGDIASSKTIYEVTLKAYIESEEVYMIRPVAGLKSVHCAALLFLSTISVVKIENFKLASCLSELSSPGLFASLIDKSALFSDLTFENNTSMALASGSLIDVSMLSSAVFQRLSVLNNTNGPTSSIGIANIESSLFPVQIIDSVFADNICPNGGALICTGICSIERSMFTHNTASGKQAAGLVYSPLPLLSSLFISIVKFCNNFSEGGAALTIIDTNPIPAKTDLKIDHSTFRDNKSMRMGSCIQITSSVQLTTTSSISNSIFTRNSAAVACIHISFLSGVLIIDNCEFSWNLGKSIAVLHSTNPASSAGVESRVVLQNSVFEFNSGMAIIGFNNMDAFSEGESRNLIFRHNIGRGFLLQWTIWHDFNSLFINNTVLESASGMTFLYYSKVTLINTRFIDNHSEAICGVLYIAGMSNVTLHSCEFSGNSAKRVAGAIQVEQYGILSAYDCVFANNSAQFEGSAIYYFVGVLEVQHILSGCSFSGNNGRSGTISLIAANVTMIDCDMYENTAKETPGILVYLSEFRVRNSRFARQSANKGTFISAPASSIIRLSNSTFTSASATDYGAALSLSSSALEITDCTFQDLISTSGVAIAAYSGSTVTIESSAFSETTALETAGGTVSITESTGRVFTSTFQEFTNGAIVGDGSDVSIHTCEFRSGSSSEGAALKCVNCGSVSVLYSVCHSLTAQSAACISLLASGPHAMYSIRFCVFDSNSGQSRGAMVVQDADISIEDSLFLLNSANFNKTADGGALYLASVFRQDCNVSITRCEFLSNSATRNGGAIYWTRMIPVLTNVTFRNNSAVYGSDLASFATYLAVKSPPDFIISNVPSGQHCSTLLSVALIDHYGQVVSTDNESFADLYPISAENTTVTGVTRVVARQGLFNFSSYEIRSQPGRTTQIKVQTTGVGRMEGDVGVIELVVDVQMRGCVIGEALMGDLCEVCPEGKFSLDPTQACSDCPDGAVCLGKSVIIPRSGYWRSSSNSTKFWKCPNSGACLGSPANSTKLSLTGYCEDGYYGNLCNGCLSGYSRSFRGHCLSCSGLAVNVSRVVIICISAIVAAVVVIKMSLISAHRIRSQYSIYLKIFLNYIQLVSVIASMELSWPTYVLQMLQVQESIGNISEQILSFDCFVSTEEKNNQQYVVFLKIVIMSCIPVLIVVSSGLFWTILSLARKNFNYMKYEMVNSIVILFFIAHPSIVRLMFDVFNCKEIEKNEYWMSSYLNIGCWDQKHTLYALAVALPSIVLWGIFAPIATLAMLRRKRNSLDALSVRIRFGFLYTGFQDSKFYWEFVILYRKVLIIVLAVFFSNISTPVQALCVMLVLIIAFLLQMKQTPFLTDVLNELEQRGILVAAITIYCGLFFLTAGLDSSTEFALFVMILVANVYFFLFWLLKTCKACCKYISMCLPKLLGHIRTQASIYPDRRLASSAELMATQMRRASVSHSMPASVNVSRRQSEDISIELAVSVARSMRTSRVSAEGSSLSGSVDID